MKGPFVRIVTASKSVYVNTDEIQCIESDTNLIRIKTRCSYLDDVIEINGIPCKTIDDAAKVLNDTYEY